MLCSCAQLWTAAHGFAKELRAGTTRTFASLAQDQLIAHTRSQIQRWQSILEQQEQLQERTLFAGIGS
jgi:hypothetical protein